MPASPHLLLSGFEPFGGSRVNPSRDLVRRLARRRVAGWRVSTTILPVAGGRAPAKLIALIDRLRPDAVIAFGEAGGSTSIAIERVAVNLRDYPFADNDGAIVREEP